MTCLVIYLYLNSLPKIFYNTPKEELPEEDISILLDNVLKFPAVGSKKFLVTIGDRTVNGLVYRDQLIITNKCSQRLCSNA